MNFNKKSIKCFLKGYPLIINRTHLMEDLTMYEHVKC